MYLSIMKPCFFKFLIIYLHLITGSVIIWIKKIAKVNSVKNTIIGWILALFITPSWVHQTLYFNNDQTKRVAPLSFVIWTGRFLNMIFSFITCLIFKLLSSSDEDFTQTINGLFNCTVVPSRMWLPINNVGICTY
jgi:hypothetical protein